MGAHLLLGLAAENGALLSDCIVPVVRELCFDRT